MTAVAPIPPAKSVSVLLANPEAQARVIPFLPEGTNIERVIAAAQLAVMQNPAIAECTPLSLVLAVAKISQWGLEIGTTAHLVPYGKVCTPVPDYRGLVDMIVASGAARSVEARVVREGDDFDYKFGTKKYIEHHPRAKSTAKITHAYAIANLRYGAFDFVVLDRDEIEAVRGKSKQWARGDLELVPWYAKKTAVRRVVNLIPKNAKLRALFADVEQTSGEVDGALEVQPDRDADGPTPDQIAAAIAAGADPDTGEDLS